MSADDSVTSRIAIFGHPLHPMLVVFPIAFLTTLPLADLVFWWTGDGFWARLACWLAVGGFAGGALAAVAGLLDFMLVRRARDHLVGWTHMLTAVMALAMAAANAQLRWDDPAGGVLPWGLVLSVTTAMMIGIAGWMGGTLTFGHGIGTYQPEEPPADAQPPGSDSTAGLPAASAAMASSKGSGSQASARSSMRRDGCGDDAAPNRRCPK